MSDLTEFQRGLIVGARLAGASVSKTTTLCGVTQGTISNVMTAYTVYGKTESAKHSSDRKTKLQDRDRRALNRIVTSQKKTTTKKLTTELNMHLNTPVSSKTMRRELLEMCINGRVAIPKPLITGKNAERRRVWCNAHKN